jgi:hypothetical protein
MYPNGREGGASDPVGSPKRESDIDCYSCRYFFITYDPQFPYGCRAGTPLPQGPLRSIITLDKRISHFPGRLLTNPEKCAR